MQGTSRRPPFYLTALPGTDYFKGHGSGPRVGKDVRIFSRALNDVTPSLPEIAEAVLALPANSLILDGEAIALRFARVKRYRKDKLAAEADTIDQCRALQCGADRKRRTYTWQYVETLKGARAVFCLYRRPQQIAHE